MFTKVRNVFILFIYLLPCRNLARMKIWQVIKIPTLLTILVMDRKLRDYAEMQFILNEENLYAEIIRIPKLILEDLTALTIVIIMNTLNIFHNLTLLQDLLS